MGGRRTSEYFYFLTVIMVALCLWLLRRIVGSPFGRMLTTVRENAERAEFIGVNVRRYELAAFVLAGAFAGLAGGLFGIFNRGVFPDFAYWTKSSEVLIMTLLGGMGTFYGPALGALVLILLNQQITSYTEYWPFVLGVIWWCCCSCFPAGWRERRGGRAPAQECPACEVRDVRKASTAPGRGRGQREGRPGPDRRHHRA